MPVLHYMTVGCFTVIKRIVILEKYLIEENPTLTVTGVHDTGL